MDFEEYIDLAFVVAILVFCLTCLTTVFMQNFPEIHVRAMFSARKRGAVRY